MSDEQDWAHWLSEVLDKGVNLSSWETDFIESLETQRAGLLPHVPLQLSEKQAALLERIYADRTP